MKVGCRISRVLQMNEIQPPEGYPPLGSCMFTHSSNCLVLAQESLVLGRGLYSLPYSRKMHSAHTHPASQQAPLCAASKRRLQGYSM